MSQNPTLYPSTVASLGVRTVATELGSNIPIQMDKELMLLDPNQNPFTLVTTQVPKRKVGDDTYRWHDDEIVPEYSVLAENHAAGAADGNVIWEVTAGHGERFAEWDVVKNMATGSWGQVYLREFAAAGTSGDQVSINGYVATLAGTAGDVIQKLGNSMEEGGGIPAAKSTAHTERTNYIQGFSNPVRFTDMAMHASDYFGKPGADYLRQHKKALLEHARAIEWAFLFNGVADLSTAETGLDYPADKGSRNVGFTMGLEYFISTYAPADNVRTEEDLTESEFYRWLEPCHEFGGTNKVLYASPVLFEMMLEWNLGQVDFRPSTKPQTLGLNFGKVALPFGGASVKLINHNMCKARGDSAYNYAFLVDHSDEKIKQAVYNGLDTKVYRDQVKDGSHEQVDEVYTRCGTQFRLAECHGMLKFKTPY